MEQALYSFAGGTEGQILHNLRYCSSFAPTNFRLTNNTKLCFVAECNLFSDDMEHCYIHVSNGILFFQRTEIFFKSLAYLRMVLDITEV